MNPFREPVYPLILAAFRRLFGGTPESIGRGSYLFPVVLFQSLLAAVTVWYFSVVFAQFAKDKRSAQLLAVIGTLSQWGVVILNRFAAKRGSSYQESIMTEGIALSLFLLFEMLLLQVEFRRDDDSAAARKTYARRLLSLCLIMLLTISTRKQLLGILFLAVAISFLTDFLRYRQGKRFLLMCLCVLLVFGGSQLFDYSYNYGLRGIWMTHTGNSMGLCSRLFYTAEEEDAMYLESETEREWFREIIAQAKDRNAHWDNLPEDTGWMDRTEHFSVAYDVIGYEIMNPVLSDGTGYSDGLSESYPSYEEFLLDVDRIEGRFAKAMLNNPRHFASLTMMLIGKGFLNSVSRAGEIFVNLLGILLYLIYLVLYVLVRLRYRKTHDTKLLGTAIFAEIVLGGIIINILLVAVMIYPQSRYMIYSMGLFYAALCMMALALKH